jgi:hypothetical protein
MIPQSQPQSKTIVTSQGFPKVGRLSLFYREGAKDAKKNRKNFDAHPTSKSGLTNSLEYGRIAPS